MTATGSTLMWILKRIRRRIPAIILLILCSIGTSIGGVRFALGSKGVIDAAVAGDKNAFFHACCTQAAIILFILLCTTMVRHLKERIHASLDWDWKKDLFHEILNSEYRAVSAYHSSELLNRLNNDVRILDDSIVSLLPSVFSMITKLISAAYVLFLLSPWFTLILVLAGAVVILITGLIRKNLKNLHKRVSEATGWVNGILQEAMEKLLAVQAMDISAEIERRAEIRLKERFALHRKRKNVSLLANTCINVMFYSAGFATLIWCSAGILTGAMSFGTMTAMTQLVNQIQNPIINLSGIIPQYIAAVAAAERLQEVDMLPKKVAVRSELPTELYGRFDSITAKQLVFTYDRDRILDGADFSLPKGSFCVIYGPSGTGKSTLLKLMLGIFTPEQGTLALQCGDEEIPVDGSTRMLFSYVPQGNLLFSGTIRDNLLVVKPDATEQEIMHATYISVMDEYLDQLPDGLDTILGESGAGLSEGQAQRLAIARAILGGAPILLLDECTSALDARTEELVLQRLKNLKDKTCIAVTHRSVMEEICDIIIQMENGKVCVNKLR